MIRFKSSNNEKKMIIIRFLCFSALMLLAGCRPFEKPNPAPLERRDMRVLLTPAQPAEKADFQLAKQPPKRVINKVFYTPVSAVVTENVPIKSLLLQLAKQAKVNIHLDPAIKGKIIYSVTNKPFVEVVDDICGQLNLRYHIKSRTLKVEPDTPYNKTYSIKFLNISRNVKSNIAVASDVFANRDASLTYTSSDNGSSSTIESTGQHDFWGELGLTLEMILAPDSKDAPDSPDSKDTPGPTYALHRHAGLLVAKATNKQHKRLRGFLRQLRSSIGAQVLIEAKVIEVNLFEQYRAGINWEKLSRGLIRFSAPFGNLAQAQRFANPGDSQKSLVSLGLKKGGFSGLLNALKEFGSSRILSSPRLTVMNNQTALLKVARNQVYFQLRYDRQFNVSVNRESINISSDIHTVPIGLVISVQPSIDLETGQILLYLRPTITRFSQTVADPAVDIARAQTASNTNVQTQPSLIPVVEVQEFETVMRLRSGETGLLGGLMEIRTTGDSSSIPGLENLRLFESTAHTNEIIELVFIVRAKIVTDGEPQHYADQRLYNLVDDPRPVAMGG